MSDHVPMKVKLEIIRKYLDEAIKETNPIDKKYESVAQASANTSLTMARVHFREALYSLSDMMEDVDE